MNVEKIRQLEEIPIPPSLQFSHPQGISTDSSIAPAISVSSSHKPFKPKLKGPIELQLIQTHNDVSSISKKTMKLHAMQLDRHNVEYEAITDRHVDALQKSAEAAQSGQSWSHLQQLGGVVLGIANIGLGAYLLSQDTGADTAGQLLIGSGIAALAGAGFDWYYDQKQDSGFLPIAVPIVMTMISLGLSIIASQYNTNMPEAKDLLDMMQMAMSAALAAGKPYLQFVSTKAQMGLIGVQKDLFLKEDSIKNLYQMIETLMREFERISRVVKRTTKHAINQALPA